MRGARVKTWPLVACALAHSLPAAAQPAGDSTVERLYRASVAAAEASLRLHETATAKAWLAEAPAPHRRWEWHYLQAQADRSIARVEAHDASVLDVAASPDGRHLASTAADGTV